MTCFSWWKIYYIFFSYREILAYSPSQAIDGVYTPDLHFYHSFNNDPTGNPNIGWAWLQVDFSYMWNIQSLDIQTRDAGIYTDIWDRISKLEVSQCVLKCLKITN